MNMSAAELANEYVRLGGKRKAAADDNSMSIRKWDDEPAEATNYWDVNIASLPAAKRREVESYLPSINSDSG
jgi:hypothetical protein